MATHDWNVPYCLRREPYPGYRRAQFQRGKLKTGWPQPIAVRISTNCFDGLVMGPSTEFRSQVDHDATRGWPPTPDGARKTLGVSALSGSSVMSFSAPSKGFGKANRGEPSASPCAVNAAVT